MSTWWMKNCPKCRGDLVEDVGLGGDRDVTCLQCGYLLRPHEMAALPPRASALPRRAARAAVPALRLSRAA
jgi:hypothetical protein